MQLKLIPLLGLLLVASCKHEAYIEPPILPSVLIYSPDTLHTFAGNPASSTAPIISGTKPIQFKLSTSPSTTEIEIDTVGRISTKPGLTSGTYKISVTATNAAGSVSFPDIFTVATSEVITFSSHIKPLVLSTCSPCHTPGGTLADYTDYALSKARVNWILDRVKRSAGTAGYMPLSKPPLSATQIDLINKWLAQGLKQ